MEPVEQGNSEPAAPLPGRAQRFAVAVMLAIAATMFVMDTDLTKAMHEVNRIRSAPSWRPHEKLWKTVLGVSMAFAGHFMLFSAHEMDAISPPVQGDSVLTWYSRRHILQMVIMAIAAPVLLNPLEEATRSTAKYLVSNTRSDAFFDTLFVVGFGTAYLYAHDNIGFVRDGQQQNSRYTGT